MVRLSSIRKVSTIDWTLSQGSSLLVWPLAALKRITKEERGELASEVDIKRALGPSGLLLIRWGPC
jgi:hypothetical protein